MSVIFKAHNHTYESIDPNDKINWIGVTTFVSHFKQKFDPVAQSIKSSQNKRSKWFGVPPERIQAIWKAGTDISLSDGTFYHDQRESDLIEIDTIERSGVPIPIIKPIITDGIKYAPVQRLVEGIYPEHFVYLKSAGICGQSDRVEVVKNIVDIIDYKTNKELKKESFKNWEGKHQMMNGILSHLQDCNFIHYALQLSCYMYMILKHNPSFKPGKMYLHHVIFEIEGEDEFGNRILKRDENGKPIVKAVVPHEVPYLKEEVRNMINYLQDHRNEFERK